MAYKSEAQKKWAHSEEGMKALGGPHKVDEWDKASEHLALPERVHSKLSKDVMKTKQPARRSSGIRWV